MKSYNHLLEQAIENVEKSLEEAAKHKRNRSYVKKFYKNKEENLNRIVQKLIDGTWKPAKHKKCLLVEGAHKKERIIEKPYWNDEQIVHHILMQPFKKIVLSRMHYYSCGCIPGKGPHFLLKHFIRWRNSYKGKTFYVAELDVKKCYDTVDLTILKQKLSKKIRDKRYLDLLFKLIDVGAQSDNRGLPKGFYTSPWLLHFYYLDLDNTILQDLKPDHYARYMDNIWIFSSSKKKLHNIVKRTMDFVSCDCDQEIKDNWQIYSFEKMYDGCIYGRHINLLGFNIHCNRISLRKGIIKRIRAKTNRIYKKHRYNLHDCSSVLSYIGYFKRTDTHEYYQNWIKPKLSISYCKSRVRKKAENDRLENCTCRC